MSENIVVDNKYIIKKTENADLFEVFNIEKEKKYVVNPYKSICECLDFRFRTIEGKCKHIDMVIANIPEVKKRIEEEDMRRKEEEKRIEEEAKKIIKAEDYRGQIPTKIVEKEIVVEAILDRWDEEQALSKIMGKVLETYVYEFERVVKKKDGTVEKKTHYELSLKGVTDLAHWMGGFAEGEGIVEEQKDKFVAKVPVTDLFKKVTVWGYADCEKTYKTGEDVKFPDRIARAKAYRNALKKLIPEPLKQRMIQMFIDHKKQEKVGEGEGGIISTTIQQVQQQEQTTTTEKILSDKQKDFLLKKKGEGHILLKDISIAHIERMKRDDANKLISEIVKG